MRAANVDARPAPAGINLAPPIRYWELTGGAVYLPDEDAVLLPDVSARVESPWIRVDRPGRYTTNVEVLVPAAGDRYLSAEYADEGRTRLGGNGNASGSLDPGVWTFRQATFTATEGNRLAEATWARSRFQVTADLGVPGTMLRNPTITIER